MVLGYIKTCIFFFFFLYAITYCIANEDFLKSCYSLHITTTLSHGVELCRDREENRIALENVSHGFYSLLSVEIYMTTKGNIIPVGRS